MSLLVCFFFFFFFNDTATTEIYPLPLHDALPIFYKELVRIYDPGDNLYLFGFSRGAFTVRTLAGFIAKCGIVDFAKFVTTDALEAAINKAYKIYCRSYRTELAKLFRKEPDPGIIK